MSDLLKEAIADAEAIRALAIENAKESLAETFGSQIKSLVDKRLQIIAEDEESYDEFEDLDTEQLHEESDDYELDLDNILAEMEDNFSDSQLEEDFDSLIEELDKEYMENEEDFFDDNFDFLNEDSEDDEDDSDVELLQTMLESIETEIELEESADIEMLEDMLFEAEEAAAEEDHSEVFSDLEDSDEGDDTETIANMTEDELELFVKEILNDMGVGNEEEEEEEEEEEGESELDSEDLEEDIDMLESILAEIDEESNDTLLDSYMNEEDEEEEDDDMSIADMDVDDLKDLIRQVLDEMDEDEVDELEEAILGPVRKMPVRESYRRPSPALRTSSYNQESNSENKRLKKQLQESYKTVHELQDTLNEVSLINSKLLYTGKLFRTYNNLTENQKVSILEYFDTVGTVEDVKKLYNKFSRALNEQTKTSAKNSLRTKKQHITEAVASRPAGLSTKPTESKILQEDTMVARLQLLAGIKK